MKAEKKASLIIVDDDPTISGPLKFLLQDEFEIQVAETRNELQSLLLNYERPPELVLLDLGLPPEVHGPDEGFKIIGDLLALSSSIKILVLSGQDDRKNVRHALALGAADFIAKPCEPELLRIRLRHALFIQSAEDSISQSIINDEMGMIGTSPAVMDLRTQIRKLANIDFPVLVEGGSGSGKELVIRALHEHGQRKDNPFLVLNCAAISAQLIEAQIFGYAKGAFTGASSAQAGFFEDAGEGTLCLDEIGEMPAELQAKLLRVLENGEYYRLGETKVRTASARIIAATNRDLKSEVQEGNFREDLYHRLSVFRIQVPPLHTRKEDKTLLLKHFNKLYSKQLNSAPFRLSADAETAWKEYTFPGNVRELRNIVIRLCASFAGQEVSAAALRDQFDPNPIWKDTDTHDRPSTVEPSAVPPTGTTTSYTDIRQAAAVQLSNHKDFNLDHTLKLWEQAYIDAALEQTGDNLSKAASLLGVNRTTLYSRMQRFKKNDS